MLVFMHCRLCLLCRRTSSRCSIVVDVVIDVVVVGLDVDAIEGFDVLLKCYILKEIE